jgi:hypothetical protein
MKAFICSLLASLMLAFGVHTASLADDGKSDDVSIDYGAQLSAEAEDALVSFQRSLDRIVAKTGAKLSNVSVDQSLSNEGDMGTLSTSCTASATVGIPGGTEVSISATAPTCTEAVNMVMDAVEDLLENATE